MRTLFWLTRKLNEGFRHRYALRAAAVLVWAGCLVLLFGALNKSGLSPTESALMALGFLSGTAWGPVIFVIFYGLRSVVFFPGSILSVLAGTFFGLFEGILITIIGANLAAAVAYTLGRFFGGDVPLEATPLRRFLLMCRRRPFLAVLIMHLTFLPYDLVNYSSGIMKLPFAHFMLGNALGTIPGIITLVSLGASLDLATLRQEGLSTDIVDPTLIALSLLVLLASLVIARWLERRGTAPENEHRRNGP